MKILFTTGGNDLNAVLDSRFGRAPMFLIYDLENGSFEVYDNSVNIAAAHGAGIAAAEAVCNLGVAAVITGNCGPKAFAALTAAGIKVYYATPDSIASLLAAYKNNELAESQVSNVAGHWIEGESIMNTDNNKNTVNNDVRVNSANSYCTGERVGRAWGGTGRGLGRGAGMGAGPGRGEGVMGRGRGGCGRGMARGSGGFPAGNLAGAGAGRGIGGGRGLGRITGLGRCVNPGSGMGFGRGMNR